MKDKKPPKKAFITPKKATQKEKPTKLNMTLEQAIALSFAPKVKPKK